MLDSHSRESRAGILPPGLLLDADPVDEQDKFDPYRISSRTPYNCFPAKIYESEVTMRIVLLGAPGSGKGTQTDAIIARYGVATVATGDLLRAEVAAGTELGLRAKPHMDAGNLVPFDIVLGMIERGLQTLAKTNPKGFMMDGFPRDLAQAEALDEILDRISQPLDQVLFFEVDYEEIVKRLLGRGRADDNEATIRNRLRVFEEKTAPLIEYYTRKGLLRTVKGTGTIDEIGQRVQAVLDEIA